MSDLDVAIKEIDNQIDALQNARRILSDILPSPRLKDIFPQLTNKEAILLILKEKGNPMKTREIYTALHDKERLIRNSTLRSVVCVLGKGGYLTRTSRGWLYVKGAKE